MPQVVESIDRQVNFGVACRGCPLRARCTRSTTGKSMRIGEHDALARAHRVRASDPDFIRCIDATARWSNDPWPGSPAATASCATAAPSRTTPGCTYAPAPSSRTERRPAPPVRSPAASPPDRATQHPVPQPPRRDGTDPHSPSTTSDARPRRIGVQLQCADIAADDRSGRTHDATRRRSVVRGPRHQRVRPGTRRQPASRRH
jgi:hypothetical protein